MRYCCKKIIMGQVHVNDAQQQNKDCYADGVLDNRDVVVLLQFLVHLFSVAAGGNCVKEDTMSRILYVLDYLSHQYRCGKRGNAERDSGRTC